ncbi:hypothetical protein Pmani_038520 [Petrolisthes manimaculis]|uniref:Uncharacterized protein n=1 Tax=Petrolisthes manimaculis TaxID=1843537 RepID=A0AAE1NE76_9EUCA|nr:hypothetical protein Pmani_038520 [Petrolisthes manimaculis]
MALKGGVYNDSQLVLLLLLLLGSSCVLCRTHRTDNDGPITQKVDDEGGEQQRIFLTGTGTGGGSTGSLTIGNAFSVLVGWDAALLVGLTLAGLIAAIILMGVLLSNEGKDDEGYYSATGYATDPHT